MAGQNLIERRSKALLIALVVPMEMVDPKCSNLGEFIVVEHAYAVRRPEQTMPNDYI